MDLCLQFMLQFQIVILQWNILQTIASFLRLLGKLSNPMGINVNKFLIARYCFILQNKLACNNTLLSIILYFQKIEKKWGLYNMTTPMLKQSKCRELFILWTTLWLYAFCSISIVYRSNSNYCTLISKIIRIIMSFSNE